MRQYINRYLLPVGHIEDMLYKWASDELVYTNSFFDDMQMSVLEYQGFIQRCLGWRQEIVWLECVRRPRNRYYA